MVAASARGSAEATEVSLGSLSVDLVTGTATMGDCSVDLSRRHLELLALLISNSNRVVSRAELSASLGLQQGRSVDVLLSGIRQKLGFGVVRTVPKRGWIIMPQALTGPASAGSSRGGGA